MTNPPPTNIYTFARAAVLLTQGVRCAIPYTEPAWVPAVTEELVARADLAVTEEHRAEQARWRARSDGATGRRRLRRAMTPAQTGPRRPRQGPRCA